MYISKLDVHW